MFSGFPESGLSSNVQFLHERPLVASWALPFPGTCECWKFCPGFYLPCHTQDCRHFPSGIPHVCGIYLEVSKCLWITGINRQKGRFPLSPDSPKMLDCFGVSWMNSNGFLWKRPNLVCGEHCHHVSVDLRRTNMCLKDTSLLRVLKEPLLIFYFL